MPRSRRLKLYEFVADLVEVGTQQLVERGRVEPTEARHLMLGIARAFCDRNAKSEVYVPEAINLVNLERNAAIWAAYQVDGKAPTYTRKFTPERARELAAEYDLSPQQIYNIIRGERESEISELQGQLDV